MHSIHLSDELKITFHERSAEFDLGVEVGSIAALMAIPLQQFTRRLSRGALAPAERLAERLGYVCAHEPDGTGNLGQAMLSVTFRKAPGRAGPSPRRFSVVGGTGA